MKTTVNGKAETIIEFPSIAETFIEEEAVLQAQTLGMPEPQPTQYPIRVWVKAADVVIVRDALDEDGKLIGSFLCLRGGHEIYANVNPEKMVQHVFNA